MKKIWHIALWIVSSLILVSGIVAAVPDSSQGVQVLSLLASPYGANTFLLKDQFELMGWEVTFAAVDSVVPNCSRLNEDFAVDLTLAGVQPTDYDVVVVMPTPGTFNRVSDPVGDLRASATATWILDRAFQQGATIYTGCSGVLLLGDAGLLDGANVHVAARWKSQCETFGGSCIIGGDQKTRPLIDGQLVTATNQRVWPAEIAAAIARSLDRQFPVGNDTSQFGISDMSVTASPIDIPEDVARGTAFGTSLSDVGRQICPVEDGFVLVGMTYAAETREDVMVVRLDAHDAVLWAKRIHGPGRDFAEGACIGPDGSIYVAGYTTSLGEGVEDAFVLRLDAEGDLLWTTTVGGDDYDAAFDVCPSALGGVAVCGLTFSRGAGLSDLLVFEVNAEGTVLWERVIGGEKLERGESIHPLADGGYILGGGSSTRSAGNVDMYAVRVAAGGGVIWEKKFGRRVYDLASSAVPLQDGGFLLTGHGDLEGSEAMALTVIKIDADGNALWTSRFGERKVYEYGMDAVELPSGKIVIGGVADDSDQTENQLWLLTLDGSGQRLQDQLIGGEGSEWVCQLALLPNGEVLAVGQTNSYGQGGFDAMILHIPTE